MTYEPAFINGGAAAVEVRPPAAWLIAWRRRCSRLQACIGLRRCKADELRTATWPVIGADDFPIGISIRRELRAHVVVFAHELSDRSRTHAIRATHRRRSVAFNANARGLLRVLQVVAAVVVVLCRQPDGGADSKALLGNDRCHAAADQRSAEQKTFHGHGSELVLAKFEVVLQAAL